VANLGYTPYYGPDVAAMTPMQVAAAQNVNQGASAFGLAAPSDPMAGMPTAETFAGGVQGYSSGPIYDQSLAALQQNRPGQYDAITGMFIDPQTGRYTYTPGSVGANPMGVGNDVMNQQVVSRAGSGGRSASRNMDRDRSSGGVFNTRQGPNMNGQAGYGAGGFTSVRDMFDGGGPGRSGDTYEGGGVVSRVGNSAGSRKGGN
jgi:hypothetical protein